MGSMRRRAGTKTSAGIRRRWQRLRLKDLRQTSDCTGNMRSDLRKMWRRNESLCNAIWLQLGSIIVQFSYDTRRKVRRKFRTRSKFSGRQIFGRDWSIGNFSVSFIANNFRPICDVRRVYKLIDSGGFGRVANWRSIARYDMTIVPRRRRFGRKLRHTLGDRWRRRINITKHHMRRHHAGRRRICHNLIRSHHHFGFFRINFLFLSVTRWR